MKLIVNETDAKMVSFYLSVAAGAREERGKYPMGLAHLVEHMILNGTKEFTGQEINQKVGMMGGDENAFTDFESIMLLLSVPHEKTDDALKVLADRIYRPGFRMDEFYEEKKVVLQEIRDINDEPNDLTDSKIFKMVFNGRLQMPIGGTVSSIKKITYNDMVSFYKKHFKNNNMVLIISCRPEINIKGRVNKFFDIDDVFVTPKKRESLKPFRNRTRNLKIYGLDQNKIYVCFPGISLNDPNKHKFDLLRVVFSDDLSSRLFYKLRSKGLVYRTSSEFFRMLDGNMYQIKASTSENNIESVKNTINDEISRITNELISDDELETAKNLLRARYYKLLDSKWGNSGLLLEKLYHDVKTCPDVYFKYVMGATKDDVLWAAQELFSRNRETFIVGGG